MMQKIFNKELWLWEYVLVYFLLKINLPIAYFVYIMTDIKRLSIYWNCQSFTVTVAKSLIRKQACEDTVNIIRNVILMGNVFNFWTATCINIPWLSQYRIIYWFEIPLQPHTELLLCVPHSKNTRWYFLSFSAVLIICFKLFLKDN